MTKEIWEEVAIPMLIDSKPAELLPHEWCLLSVDGLDCHCMSVLALEKLYAAQIILVQERAQCSEILQVLDVSCFGPLNSNIQTEIRNYRNSSIGGINNLTQYEFPFLYVLVVNKALSRSNIISGFRKTGLFPLQSADSWFGKYAETCGIELAKTVTSPI